MVLVAMCSGGDCPAKRKTIGAAVAGPAKATKINTAASISANLFMKNSPFRIMSSVS